MKMIVVLMVGAIFVSCSTYQHPLDRDNTAFQGNGGNKQQFEKDKYECMKENQYMKSGAYVNRYFGSSSSEMAFDPDSAYQCMKARGWYLVDKTTGERVE